ncbi:hypothetical protein IPH67_04600 [bacterium]|nr:MAG: hypothetical protein IPH67_04600 [bacterium]
MSGKGCGYFKAVLFFFAFSIAQVWAGETNEFVFVRSVLNTDFFKQADQIKQFLVNEVLKLKTYHILTKKGQLFESIGALTAGSDNKIMAAHDFASDHDKKMLHIGVEGTAVYLSSNNQLVSGNNVFSSPICTSTPYKLESLSVKKNSKKNSEKNRNETAYIVASSWPNIHFVSLDSIKGGWSRLQKTFPRWFKRTNPEEKLAKCTLKNAYLLDVGQEGEDQYIIYAHVVKETQQARADGPRKARAKDFISRFRNIRTEYPTFTIKKWTITKDQTFENIIAFVESENQTAIPKKISGRVTVTIEGKEQAEDQQLQIPNAVPTTLCTFQNVPVDGSHVPFIIDYRNDKQWAVVRKKKDGYYLHTSAKSGEKLLLKMMTRKICRRTSKKLSLVIVMAKNLCDQLSLRCMLKAMVGLLFIAKKGRVSWMVLLST